MYNRQQTADAIQNFSAKAATQTVADATTARKYGESYIAAQNFINEIVGQTLPISFHNN